MHVKLILHLSSFHFYYYTFWKGSGTYAAQSNMSGHTVVQK